MISPSQGCNIVLDHTFEYRQPSVQKREEAAAAAAAKTAAAHPSVADGTVALDMTSRFLGLVVVPGKHIVKIEVEEFASQMQEGQSPYA